LACPAYDLGSALFNLDHRMEQAALEVVQLSRRPAGADVTDQLDHRAHRLHGEEASG
jgi:hypothetical protein